MTRRPIVGAIASGALLIALVGCGAAATPIPASGGPSAAAPSAAAASGAAPSTEASLAEPSAAQPSGAEPSTAGASAGAQSSFTLPSEAKDLEALLPDQLCGAKTTKFSLAGASFMSTADPQFTAALSAIGKSPSDVSFAIAQSAASGCGAAIFRIAGADTAKFQQAMLTAAQNGGETPTQASVGGKDVFVTTAASGKSYVYFKGDAAFIAMAKNDADAASILQALP